MAASTVKGWSCFFTPKDLICNVVIMGYNGGKGAIGPIEETGGALQ